VGGVVSLVAIVALFMSAKAHDQAIYYSGLAIFVACVLFVFLQIKRAYDKADGAGR
jgi:hypothetical protein